MQLTNDAKIILRHFRYKGTPQGDYEYPATLAELFDDVEKSEIAQEELYLSGLISLGPQVSQSHRVRAAALTLDGVRYLAKHDLDD